MTHNTSLKQDWSVFKNKQINHRQQSNDLNLVMNATSIFSETGGVSGKEFTCQCGRCKRLGFNPYCYLGVGSGNLLQSSCWENSMDRRAWGATVHRVTKSRTWPSKWAHVCVLTKPQIFAVMTTDLNIFIWLCVNHSVLSNSLWPPWTAACQAPLSMGILQARILEWVAMPSSRGSSQPRDQTHVSCIAGGFFTIWAKGISCLALWWFKI